MKLEEVEKLTIGDLITYSENPTEEELGLIVGKTKETIQIDWIEEGELYIGNYPYRSNTTSYFWDTIERVP